MGQVLPFNPDRERSRAPRPPLSGLPDEGDRVDCPLGLRHRHVVQEVACTLASVLDERRPPEIMIRLDPCM